MNLKIVFLLTFLMIRVSGFSQSNYKNGGFLELGGSGALYSLNYERQLPHGLLARVGFTYLPPRTIAFPLTFGKIFGKKSHHFEIDAGLLLANSSETLSNNSVKRVNVILGTGFVGYRYQKADKRMFYRAGFSCFYRFLYRESYFNDEPPTKFLPWAALSIGYRF
ncbi:MAG: hypothetical protein HOP30_00395 [Cyclobacteriaceae bacterium]|nr:hypothetical protein [Cyclobacteriaceae bacterium]